MEKQTEIQPRNPLTRRRHRREVFWQITFPFGMGTLLLLGVCGLTAWSGFNGGVSLWRDISLIWLLAPALILSLLVLALTGGLAYGVVRLIQVLPAASYRLQRIFERIADQSYQISDRMLQPLVRLRTGVAGVQAIFRKRT